MAEAVHGIAQLLATPGELAAIKLAGQATLAFTGRHVEGDRGEAFGGAWAPPKIRCLKRTHIFPAVTTEGRQTGP